nr:hypothetical protein [uncultured Dorea sp.]
MNIRGNGMVMIQIVNNEVKAMQGLILRKREKEYSYFDEIFTKIPELSEEYNWLITYPECYPISPEIRKILTEDEIWIKGEKLGALLKQERFQWIWGVLSGFKKTVPISKIKTYSLPYAENYEGFWKNPITIQHPLADIEIVAWDSSCTLFISKEEWIIEEIKELYPLSEDLEKYNER